MGKNKNEDCYLGLVLVGAGSCWHYAKTPEEAARLAVGQLQRDWSSLFDFKAMKAEGAKVTVNVYDVTDFPTGQSFRFGHEGVVPLHEDGTAGEGLERYRLIEEPLK